MHQTCAGDHLFVEQGSSQERPVDGRHDLFEGVGDLLFVEDLDRGRALAYDHKGGRGLDPLYAQWRPGDLRPNRANRPPPPRGGVSGRLRK